MESKVVYDAFEGIFASGTGPAYCECLPWAPCQDSLRWGRRSAGGASWGLVTQGGCLRRWRCPALADAVKEFVGTGLERGPALEKDIAEMQAKFGLAAPASPPDSPGHKYAA